MSFAHVSPLVSVVVPSTGDRDHLADALESLISQSYETWECLLVVDGPNLRTAVPADDRIREIRHAHPYQGPGAARNTGIAFATGEFVAFLDDDDLISPRRLEVALREIGDRNMHVCGIQQMRRDGTTMGPPSVPAAPVDLLVQPLHLGQALVRRAAILQFNPALRLGEDVEWFIRMAGVGPPATGTSVGYLLRRHAGDRPGADSRIRYACRRAIVAAHEDRLRSRRGVLAHHLSRVASAALLDGGRARTAWWAARSLLTQPSVLGARLLLRAVWPSSGRSGI